MDRRAVLAVLLVLASCGRDRNTAPSAKPAAWDATPPPKTSKKKWTWVEAGALAASPVAVPGKARALSSGRAIVWGDPPQVFDGKTGAFRTAKPRPECAKVTHESLVLLDDEIVFTAGASCGYDVERDAWVSVPHFAVHGSGWSASGLRNGDVLLTGGARVDSNAEPLRDASLLDHDTKAIVALPNTHVARFGHSSLRLIDGSALLASAKGTKMELYEPSHRTFRLLDEQKYDGRTAVLENGRVIFLANDGTCGLYDPSSKQWIGCGSMNVVREEFSMTVVEDGLLAIGGFRDKSSNSTSDVVELYDSHQEAWIVLPSLPIGRAQHAAIRLTDGRVLVVGGDGKTDPKRSFLLSSSP